MDNSQRSMDSFLVSTIRCNGIQDNDGGPNIQTLWDRWEEERSKRCNNTLNNVGCKLSASLPVEIDINNRLKGYEMELTDRKKGKLLCDLRDFENGKAFSKRANWKKKKHNHVKFTQAGSDAQYHDSSFLASEGYYTFFEDENGENDEYPPLPPAQQTRQFNQSFQIGFNNYRGVNKEQNANMSSQTWCNEESINHNDINEVNGNDSSPFDCNHYVVNLSGHSFSSIEYANVSNEQTTDVMENSLDTSCESFYSCNSETECNAYIHFDTSDVNYESMFIPPFMNERVLYFSEMLNFVVNNEYQEFVKKKYNINYNLILLEWKALQALSKSRDIIFKPANKGNKLVTMSYTQYLAMCEEHLSDRDVYERVDINAYDTARKEYEVLLNKGFRLGYFTDRQSTQSQTLESVNKLEDSQRDMMPPTNGTGLPSQNKMEKKVSSDVVSECSTEAVNKEPTTNEKILKTIDVCHLSKNLDAGRIQTDDVSTCVTNESSNSSKSHVMEEDDIPACIHNLQSGNKDDQKRNMNNTDEKTTDVNHISKDMDSGKTLTDDVITTTTKESTDSNNSQAAEADGMLSSTCNLQSGNNDEQKRNRNNTNEKQSTQNQVLESVNRLEDSQRDMMPPTNVTGLPSQNKKEKEVSSHVVSECSAEAVTKEPTTNEKIPKTVDVSYPTKSMDVRSLQADDVIISTANESSNSSKSHVKEGDDIPTCTHNLQSGNKDEQKRNVNNTDEKQSTQQQLEELMKEQNYSHRNKTPHTSDDECISQTHSEKEGSSNVISECITEAIIKEECSNEKIPVSVDTKIADIITARKHMNYGSTLTSSVINVAEESSSKNDLRADDTDYMPSGKCDMQSGNKDGQKKNTNNTNDKQSTQQQAEELIKDQHGLLRAMTPHTSNAEPVSQTQTEGSSHLVSKCSTEVIIKDKCIKEKTSKIANINHVSVDTDVGSSMTNVAVISTTEESSNRDCLHAEGAADMASFTYIQQFRSKDEQKNVNNINEKQSTQQKVEELIKEQQDLLRAMTPHSSNVEPVSQTQTEEGSSHVVSKCSMEAIIKDGCTKQKTSVNSDNKIANISHVSVNTDTASSMTNVAVINTIEENSNRDRLCAEGAEDVASFKCNQQFGNKDEQMKNLNNVNKTVSTANYNEGDLNGSGELKDAILCEAKRDNLTDHSQTTTLSNSTVHLKPAQKEEESPYLSPCITVQVTVPNIQATEDLKGFSALSNEVITCGYEEGTNFSTLSNEVTTCGYEEGTNFSTLSNEVITYGYEEGTNFSTLSNDVITCGYEEGTNSNELHPAETSIILNNQCSLDTEHEDEAVKKLHSTENKTSTALHDGERLNRLEEVNNTICYKKEMDIESHSSKTAVPDTITYIQSSALEIPLKPYNDSDNFPHKAQVSHYKDCTLGGLGEKDDDICPKEEMNITPDSTKARILENSAISQTNAQGVQENILNVLSNLKQVSNRALVKEMQAPFQKQAIKSNKGGTILPDLADDEKNSVATGSGECHPEKEQPETQPEEKAFNIYKGSGHWTTAKQQRDSNLPMEEIRYTLSSPQLKDLECNDVIGSPDGRNEEICAGESGNTEKRADSQQLDEVWLSTSEKWNETDNLKEEAIDTSDTSSTQEPYDIIQSPVQGNYKTSTSSLNDNEQILVKF
ncbi:uncharacterized protein LOC122815066 [Protopterus annectens]|uniref:uncharacterized protein LOC122815066 n=1 Tax=Protopterus annectens TaxID=7888 RepID=UPI001CF93FCF|nr:uncharacterized protein LOC122815066 [Protopterus annectens]